jgi:hypothetical protein
MSTTTVPNWQCPGCTQWVTTTEADHRPACGTIAPADGERHGEVWAYAGLAPGVKRATVAVWYDANRRRLAFKPLTGTRPVPGCLYRVEVTRDGTSVTRHGEPVYDGPADGEWYAQLEAEALAGAREIARESLERKMARDGSQLGALIAPLEQAAATMTYAQREALLALVTRRVYRAERPRKDPS